MGRKRIAWTLFAFGFYFLLHAFPLPAASAHLHIDVGLNHFYKKRYLEAFREFKTALSIDPQNADAHFNLGRVYRLQGFIKEAVAELELAISFNPRHSSAIRELNEIRQLIKTDLDTQLKIKGQNEALRQRLTTGQETPAQKRGEDLLRKGDFSQAAFEFQQALKADPHNPQIHKVLGFIYFRQNNFSEALGSYERAQKYSVNDSEISYSIGMIHLRTQNAEKAVSYLKKAVELSPDLVKAQYGLGEAYESLGQFEDALFQYRKCLQLNPKLSAAEERIQEMARVLGFNYFSRGTYYYQQGEYEKAEALLSLALKYGGMSQAQNQQADEMLVAAKYWIKKQRADENRRQERQEVREQSYINKNISVRDVTTNPLIYMGQSVAWSGFAICSDTESRKPRFFVNGSTDTNADSNLDFSFEVVFPKELPNDPRVSDYSELAVKGKVVGVGKILNTWTNTLSSRKQPVIEATEVTFTRENYEQPLILRFY